MAKRNAVGIDLGTTYSCVGTFQHGKVEIIANDQGNRTTPSYVGFTDTERLIGDAAKNQVAVNPTNTIFDAKRLIGRKFDDDTVKSDMKHWPFKVIEHCGLPRLKVEYMSEEKVFTPEEISSMVLTKMKDTAEAYLGTAVTEAVITVSKKGREMNMISKGPDHINHINHAVQQSHAQLFHYIFKVNFLPISLVLSLASGGKLAL